MNKYEIMRAVKEHHEYVAKMPEMSVYAQPVMTVLIGSQNYGLDTENSDIDTFTFVIPSLFSLAINKKEFRGEFEVKDGKCMYKDFRDALNLLKKTSAKIDFIWPDQEYCGVKIIKEENLKISYQTKKLKVFDSFKKVFIEGKERDFGVQS